MDSTVGCIAAWMPRQRWYAAKGRPPTLRLVSWWDLPAEGCEIRTFLVADEGASPAVLYQVPVVARPTTMIEPAAADHVVGSPQPGTTFVDGPFDPAYAEALLRVIAGGRQGQGPGTVAVGRPSQPIEADEPRTAHVLTGEQSNTSMIYRPAGGGTPIICKVFRQVHPGLNPDIELTTALAQAGSSHVPPAIGSIEGTWPDLAAGGATATGSLAFAQEFLPGVEDAWRVALHAASAGDDFGARAHALGEATAEVHVSLATLFPTRPALPGDKDAVATSWHRRLTLAMAEVPALAGRREAIEAVYSRATAGEWPPFQRIHGDYHLGQVMHDPRRGWVLVDFEGEPLRPMADGSADLALRDVAGMLRSFDYVAGSLRLDQPDRSPAGVRDWVRAARRGFVEGYARVSGMDLEARSGLLAALELDKAVYEAIYETRNRPTWVAIPMDAITRLVERAAAA